MIKNSLSDFKTDAEKLSAYLNDKNKMTKTIYAYKSDGSFVPLGQCRLVDLEHVAGLWRVQNEFPHKIENVRGKDFVIGKKIPYKDTSVDLYEAYPVGENCYGKYIFDRPDYIVGISMTKRGKVSAYGTRIEDVCAYLGRKITYGIFRDVIFDRINTQKQK